MTPEDFLKMPIFKNMMKNQAEVDNMCFDRSSLQVKDMMQTELKKAKQEITAEKFAPKQRTVQTEKNGP